MSARFLAWTIALCLLGCWSFSSPPSYANATAAHSPPLRPRDYTVLSSSSLARIVNVSAQVSDAILDFHNPSSSLAKMLIPRAVGSQNLTDVQNLIRDHFAHLTTAIGSTSTSSSRQIKTWHKFEDTFDANTPYGSHTFTNLVFTHDPDADRKFVIAAHIDSKFFPGPPENGFVGATDSAAPCAMMLELATTLTPLLDRLVSRWNSDNKPRYGQRTTLQLVFFDGEEAFKDWTAQDSIYGAKHLAEVWSKIETTPSPVSPQRTQLSTIDSFILLDLLGVAGPNIRCYFLETGWLYDAMVDVENRLATQGLLWPGVKGDTWSTQSTPTGQKAKTFFEKRVDQFYTFGARIEDDHLPFLERGVPILHMIPIPWVGCSHANLLW